MIYIASDHRGFDNKEEVIKFFKKRQIAFIDGGVKNKDRVNSKPLADKACEKVLKESCEFAILICGTGIAMCMAANRHKGIRAALACNKLMVERAKTHNNANVLCLPAELLSGKKTIKLIKIFLNAKFLGGVYHERNLELDN